MAICLVWAVGAAPRAPCQTAGVEAWALEAPGDQPDISCVLKEDACSGTAGMGVLPCLFPGSRWKAGAAWRCRPPLPPLVWSWEGRQAGLAAVPPRARQPGDGGGLPGTPARIRRGAGVDRTAVLRPIASHGDISGAAQGNAAERQHALRKALREGAVEETYRLLGPAGTSAERAPAAEGGERGFLIPGGLRLLRELSRVNGPEAPGEYLVTFARAAAGGAGLAYGERLLASYARLQRIRQEFPLGPNGTEVVIRADSPEHERQAHVLLGVLGYRLHGSRGRFAIGLQDGDSAAGQELAAALDLNGRAIAESLNRTGSFRFRISDDFAPAISDESRWTEAVSRTPNPLGFAGALVRDPALAKVFAGLASAGPGASRALLARTSLPNLAMTHGSQLFHYGAQLSLNEQGNCAVPGGKDAEAVWEELTGANPRDGAKFLDALLKKDSGMMLAYFAALHGTTASRQKWFLQSTARAKLFYALLVKSRGALEAKAARICSVCALLQELPLREDGGVRFPGGAPVWQMIAQPQGGGHSPVQEEHAGGAANDRDETILKRLALARLTLDRRRFTKLDCFLSTVRMEAAFGRPLRREEALSLAGLCGSMWAYPILTALPSLGEQEFAAFLAWADGLAGMPTAHQNVSLGLVGHIATIEGLLLRGGSIPPPEAAAIFGSLCREMRSAEDLALMADAARKALGRIATALGSTPSGLDAALEEPLLGPAETLAGQRRRKEFREVLKAQKTPALGLILAALDASAEGIRGPGMALEAAAALENVAPKLEAGPSPVPRTAEALMAVLKLWANPRLDILAAQFRQKAAQSQPNNAELQQVSLKSRRALAPWLELALRGIVGGVYFRPADVPVSEDPNLMRKYIYTWVSTPPVSIPFPEFRNSIATSGKCLVGSPGGMAAAAGLVALAARTSADGYSAAVEAKQIGSVRNAQLHRLRAADLQAVRLAWAAGREWISEASYDPGVVAGLEEAMAGLASPARIGRASLLLERLRRIHRGDSGAPASPGGYKALWDSVWNCFSPSDLFWLGRLRQGAGPDSVAWRKLQELPAEFWNGPVNELAPTRLEHSWTSTPRLAQLPPYESYAEEAYPGRLAERLSEILLWMALAAEEAGLPPESLALLAEPVSRRLLAGLRMTGPGDWRSAADLWKRLRASELAELYQQEMEKGP